MILDIDDNETVVGGLLQFNDDIHKQESLFDYRRHGHHEEVEEVEKNTKKLFVVLLKLVVLVNKLLSQ